MYVYSVVIEVNLANDDSLGQPLSISDPKHPSQVTQSLSHSVIYHTRQLLIQIIAKSNSQLKPPESISGVWPKTNKKNRGVKASIRHLRKSTLRRSKSAPPRTDQPLNRHILRLSSFQLFNPNTLYINPSCLACGRSILRRGQRCVSRIIHISLCIEWRNACRTPNGAAGIVTLN